MITRPGSRLPKILEGPLLRSIGSVFFLNDTMGSPGQNFRNIGKIFQAQNSQEVQRSVSLFFLLRRPIHHSIHNLSGAHESCVGFLHLAGPDAYLRCNGSGSYLSFGISAFGGINFRRLVLLHLLRGSTGDEEGKRQTSEICVLHYV